MNSGTLVRQRARISDPRVRGLRNAVNLPGADVLLLFSAAALALCTFELAGWLASAPLATLVFSVALVPLALFFTAIVSRRDS